MGITRTVALVLVASAALALTGCTNDDSGARRHACPEQLPTPPAGVEGFRDFATELPKMPDADAAWLCKYVSAPTATPGSRSGAMVWSLEGEPAQLPAAGAAAVSEMVQGFTAFPGDVACTLDLGPRWLVVFQAGEDTFGITIDDYGCREARLTDDPFSVAHGYSTDPRLVRGSLSTPRGVLVDLKAAAGIA
jgi:hypothetical protein